MKNLISVLFISIFISSNAQAPLKKVPAAGEKWSVRMANSVLAKSDSLIYYVDRNPKWAYDVALLGMAIDRLGKVNPKYSKYMETWVDHFVKPDGTVTDYNPSEYNLDRILPGRNVITLYKGILIKNIRLQLIILLVSLRLSQRPYQEVTGIKISILLKCGSMGFSWHQHTWHSTQKNSIYPNGSMQPAHRRK